MAGVVMEDNDVRWMIVDEIHTERSISVGFVAPSGKATFSKRENEFMFATGQAMRGDPRTYIGSLRYSVAERAYFAAIANAVAIVCGDHDEP